MYLFLIYYSTLLYYYLSHSFPAAVITTYQSQSQSQ